ncbi:hypothetical protein BDZ91DRAFT_713074 [Kalaharituber pfeilii]|nr:hypothetical protein BDZ91DRAFT_713074 [Kalaharituber pfeilii]
MGFQEGNEEKEEYYEQRHVDTVKGHGCEEAEKRGCVCARKRVLEGVQGVFPIKRRIMRKDLSVEQTLSDKVLRKWIEDAGFTLGTIYDTWEKKRRVWNCFGRIESWGSPS